MRSETKFLPALRFHFLTPIYDLVSRSTREYFFKKRLIRMAKLDQGDRILDVGCGTGTLAIMIKSDYPQVAVTAIDCDEAMLNIARSKTARKNLAIDYKNAFSNAIPLSDSSIDACFSTLLFHHLTRDQKVQTLSEIHRLLRQDGELLIADWGKPRNFVMKLLSMTERIFDGKVTSDNLNGLLPELVKAAGFGKVELREQIDTFFGTLDLMSAIKS